MCVHNRSALLRALARRNYFTYGINESVVLQTAAALVATGLRDAGFTYLNIDAGSLRRARGPGGKIAPDPIKFPRGFRYLADHLHGMAWACTPTSRTARAAQGRVRKIIMLRMLKPSRTTGRSSGFLPSLIRLALHSNLPQLPPSDGSTKHRRRSRAFAVT